MGLEGEMVEPSAVIVATEMANEIPFCWLLRASTFSGAAGFSATSLIRRDGAVRGTRGHVRHRHSAPSDTFHTCGSAVEA